MKKILRALGIILLILIIGVVAFYFWGKSNTRPVSEHAVYYSPDRDVVAERNDSILRVATYNIGYLSGMTNNLPVRPKREFYANNEKRVIPALRNMNADIIGFQEIDYDSRRSYHTNQAEMICDSLIQYGAFAVNWDKRYVPFPAWPPKAQFGQILSGQAVMSRYPLTDHKVEVMEKVDSNPFFYNAMYLDRLAQIVTVNHPVKKFKVINLHAEAFDPATRGRQMKYLYDLFWELEKECPVIIMGDFNSDPEVKDAAINTFLDDTRFSVLAFDRQNPKGSTKSFPSSGPNERLDYIFVNSADFEVLDSHIASEFGDISDHLPCVGTLKFK